MVRLILSLILLGSTTAFGQSVFDSSYSPSSQIPQTRLEAPEGALGAFKEVSDGVIPENVRTALTQSVVVKNIIGNGMANKGSGVYLGDGLYSSAWHVVRDKPNGQIIIEWKNGKRSEAKVVGHDAVFDMVLLETDEKPAGGVPLAKANILTGDTVFLAGYSQGPLQAWRGRVTQLVAPTGVRVPDWTYSTGGAISGDSGGPVLDASAMYVGPLWGSTGTQTCFTNTGRFQRFLLPWNARLAAWQLQGNGCFGGGYCPPNQPQQYQPPQYQQPPYGGGRVPIDESPGGAPTNPPANQPPVNPPPQINPPQTNPPQSGCDCERPKGCDCDDEPECEVDIEDLAGKVADILKKDGSFRGEKGDPGLMGPMGPQGARGPQAEVTDQDLAVIAAAVYEKMKGDPAFRGPPGRDGKGISESELASLKADILASLPNIRVLLVDGSNKEDPILDDETYAPGDPIVIDFQRYINVSKQRDIAR